MRSYILLVILINIEATRRISRLTPFQTAKKGSNEEQTLTESRDLSSKKGERLRLRQNIAQNIPDCAKQFPAQDPLIPTQIIPSIEDWKVGSVARNHKKKGLCTL